VGSKLVAKIAIDKHPKKPEAMLNLIQTRQFRR
jgi:hypothetical protein